jgi:hypothetical protein
MSDQKREVDLRSAKAEPEQLQQNPISTPSSPRKDFYPVEELEGIWTFYSESTISDLEARGKIVLVDGEFGLHWIHLSRQSTPQNSKP